MRTPIINLAAALAVCTVAFAAPGRLAAQTPALDSLAREAAGNWPALAETRALRDAAAAQRLEAQRGFRPSVNVGGTYTLAAGGRTIALPLGDLLNPAYTTLNQLTQRSDFPVLDNQEEALLPNNFYDARVRVVQPILRPEVRLARQLAAAGIEAQTAGLEVVRTELRAAVRTAYYQLASARAAVAIYAAAEDLTDEAYRTTASLVRNGAALPLARERITAERAEVRAARAAARATEANALAQLNYLLGRPLDTPLPTSGGGVRRAPGGRRTPSPEAGSPLPPEAGSPLTPATRAELAQLRAGVRVAELNSELERQFRRPRLGLQLDAGSQDFDFGLQPYVLAGLSLDVPLYDGGRHAARTQRLEAERRAAEARFDDARRGFALQLEVARNDLAAAEARLAAYAPALAAAQRTYADAETLYRAGETGYVELLDAQNQLTTTRLRQSLASYDTALRYVALLRAAGR